MSQLDICPNCGHLQANVNNAAWQRTCRNCGWDKRVMPHPDLRERAEPEVERFEVRYHVPRSQVWRRSRGRQSGDVHLHVREPFVLGRIRREKGQALCGRRGWYERPLDELEVAPPCPRCVAVAARNGERTT